MVEVETPYPPSYSWANKSSQESRLYKKIKIKKGVKFKLKKPRGYLSPI